MAFAHKQQTSAPSISEKQAMEPAESQKYRDKIMDDHPLLYRGRNKPITESLMSWGFSCEDGWLPLIERLSDRIEAEIIRLHNEGGVAEKDLPEVKQVKQKFGGLRFFVRPKNDTIEAAVMEARDEADRTCEFCGSPGKLYEKRHYTCCKDCAKQMGFEI
jgi:hypothetical protein